MMQSRFHESNVDGFQSKTINPDLFADDFIEVGTGFQEDGADESMQQWKMMTALRC